jgi:hypothetical protein
MENEMSAYLRPNPEPNTDPLRMSLAEECRADNIAQAEHETYLALFDGDKQAVRKLAHGYDLGADYEAADVMYAWMQMHNTRALQGQAAVEKFIMECNAAFKPFLEHIAKYEVAVRVERGEF